MMTAKNAHYESLLSEAKIKCDDLIWLSVRKGKFNIRVEGIPRTIGVDLISYLKNLGYDAHVSYWKETDSVGIVSIFWHDVIKYV